MSCVVQNSCMTCQKRHTCGGLPVVSKTGGRTLSRRDFVRLSMAASVAVFVPPLIIGKLSSAYKIQRWNWQGRAMGTEISIQICSKNQKQAEAITRLCIDEISRLESIFTLYSDDSELVRLNKNGVLRYPAPELVELMSLASRYSVLTNGYFDMTLQPIWQVIKKESINSPNIKTALDLVDYQQVKISPEKISFTNPKMAVSLNGIAQGYITDKITELLKLKNINSALINIGEIRALGGNEDNKPWKVGLYDPRKDRDAGAYIKAIPLYNKALSTTGGYGLSFSKDGKKHHIFNPKNGKNESRYLSLSVMADTATKADALSTAFYLMETKQIKKTLNKFTDVNVIILHNNGNIETL